MALPWKTYSPKRQLVASCRFPEDAAALVGLHGPGATIKFNDRVVYRETDLQLAADSVDKVAEISRSTARQHAAEHYGRFHGDR